MQKLRPFKYRGFGEHLGTGESREKPKSKINDQNENYKAIVSDMEDTIVNAFVKMANALSGCEGSRNAVGIGRN